MVAGLEMMDKSYDNMIIAEGGEREREGYFVYNIMAVLRIYLSIANLNQGIMGK